ncbi:MAG TPA: hypothetical protein VK390_15350 [Propionibacteriaceae bacterium]|nr:hypothetical protein [Propionibacteriaceae bacterium]
MTIPVGGHTLWAGPFWMDDIGVSDTAYLGPVVPPPTPNVVVSLIRPI